MVKPNTSPGLLSGFGLLLVRVYMFHLFSKLLTKYALLKNAWIRGPSFCCSSKVALVYLSTPGDAACETLNICNATAHLAATLRVGNLDVESQCWAALLLLVICYIATSLPIKSFLPVTDWWLKCFDSSSSEMHSVSLQANNRNQRQQCSFCNALFMLFLTKHAISVITTCIFFF